MLLSAWPTPDLRSREWALEGHPPLLVRQGFGQLALAATLPDARGHGICDALVRERPLAAPGVVVGGLFSDHSRHGIEQLGFPPVTRFTLWHRARPTAARRSPRS